MDKIVHAFSKVDKNRFYDLIRKSEDTAATQYKDYSYIAAAEWWKQLGELGEAKRCLKREEDIIKLLGQEHTSYYVELAISYKDVDEQYSYRLFKKAYKMAKGKSDKGEEAKEVLDNFMMLFRMDAKKATKVLSKWF